MWVWIVWGQRAYGVVEMHGGEHARTVFQHLYFVPLIPIESQWVGPTGECIPIVRHAKSIAAAYLRTWGPVAALGPLAIAPGIVTAALAGTLLTLHAWSWTWHPLPRSSHRRSDFNLLAFGSRCDPARMTREQRDDLLAALKARAVSEMRPPEDVARFGAASLHEAVTAYGVLRLGEIDGGECEGLADQLLGGKHEATIAEGPYRDGAHRGEPTVLEQVAIAASNVTAAEDSLWSRTGFRWIMAVGCAVVAAFGLAFNWQALLATRRPGLVDLAAGGPLDRFVSVTCDSTSLAFQLADDKRPDNVFECAIGNRILVVVAGTDSVDREVEGKLRSLHDGPFRRDIIPAPEIVPVYVVVTSKSQARLVALFSITCAITAVTFVVLALRRRTRRSSITSQA